MRPSLAIGGWRALSVSRRLQVEELSVLPFKVQQLLVTTALDDPTVFEHQDRSAMRTVEKRWLIRTAIFPRVGSEPRGVSRKHFILTMRAGNGFLFCASSAIWMNVLAGE